MADVSMRVLLQAVGAGGVISSIQSISSSLGSGGLTGALTAAGAAAVVGLGVSAVNAASDFQTSLAKVQAYAGLSQQATEQMAQSILQLAPQIGEAPKALADSLYSVASAGFKGADGLTILKYAGMTATASNSDATTITQALVGSLNALGLSASSAGSITDELNATVKQGLISWDQYGSVVGKLAGSVSAAGGSATDMQANFADLNASLDVYTNSGISAHQASMWLTSDMSLLYGKTDTLDKNARALGITFDQTAFTSMDFAHKIQYLTSITGDNRIELTKLLGGNSAVAQSVQFLGGHYDQLNGTIQSITGSMKDGKTSQDLFAVAQDTLSFRTQQANAAFQSLLITIGTQLLPILSNLLASVTPLIGSFANWITVADNVRPVLIGVASAITAALIPALIDAMPAIWGFASGVIAATWPFLLIAVAVGGAVVAFQHFYETNAPFKAFIDSAVKSIQQIWQEIQTNFLPTLQRLGGWIQTSVLPAFANMGAWIQKYIWPFLVQVGQYMAATFIPVWNNLVQVWQTQLQPAFAQLGGLFQQFMPLFKVLGVVLLGIGVLIVGVVVVALGILVGVIDGIAKGIGYFIEGLATMAGGITQMFKGIVEVVGGVISLVKDIIHGNWSGVVKDFIQIGKGFVDQFWGLWTTIVGLLQAAWGLISGVVGGMIQGIIGFFQHLFDELVGHSIVPDMVNKIINFIASLPGSVWGFIESMVAGAIARFNQFKSAAIDVFDHIVSGIINAFGGIGSGIWGAIRTGLNDAVDLLNSWIRNLNGIQINVGSFHAGFDIPTIPHLASGGVLTRGGLVTVGEFGAETVALPPGAAVYPHGSSPAGSGGVTNIFYINLSTMARSQSEVKRLVDMVEDEIGRRFRTQTSGYAAGNIW